MFNYKRQNHIATISLVNGPSNVLTLDLLKALEKTFDELKEDKEVKVILLHGEGKCFSAGVDFKELTSALEELEFSPHSIIGKRLCEKIENLNKPVIAVIHGAALGTGLALALSCHMRLVARNARLGMPEVEIGLIPGFSGTQRLTRFVGEAKALEMMLTAKPVIGDEMLKLGLANSVHFEEDLLEEAYKLAGYIANKSLHSIGFIMQLQVFNRPARYKEGIEQEVEFFTSIFKTDGAKQGMASFFDGPKGT